MNNWHNRFAKKAQARYNAGMFPLPTDERAPLCAALQQYMQRCPARAAEAARILQFVASTPDCFCRTHAAGHITGSAWLLNPAGDKALLTLHRNLKRWMQTGGHADGDPDVLRTALREAEEESGISGIRPLSADIMDVDIHRIPANPRKGEGEHLHYDIRYLLQAPHEHYVISEESDDLAWWCAADFAARTAETDEAVLRLARLWGKRQKLKAEEE